MSTCICVGFADRQDCPLVQEQIKLYISSYVMEMMQRVFAGKSFEQGFILGCSSDLFHIDTCCCVPAIREDRLSYRPDSQAAQTILEEWYGRDICFCGFIHSHVVDQIDYSAADLLFAQKLCLSFTLPFIWFGLAVRKGQSDIQFYFHAASLDENGALILHPAQIMLQ